MQGWLSPNVWRLFGPLNPLPPLRHVMGDAAVDRVVDRVIDASDHYAVLLGTTMRCFWVGMNNGYYWIV